MEVLGTVVLINGTASGLLYESWDAPRAPSSMAPDLVSSPEYHIPCTLAFSAWAFRQTDAWIVFNMRVSRGSGLTLRGSGEWRRRPWYGALRYA